MGKQYLGKAVCNGIAVGKIFVFKKNEVVIDTKKSIDADTEIKRFEHAVSDSVNQLGALYDKALAEAGEESAFLFEVHQMLLEGDEFKDAVLEAINEGLSAEASVQKVGKEFSEMFAAMDDEYMQARSADFLDISNRVLQNLTGVTLNDTNFTEPVIVVADDLTPSETVAMDKKNILAFVTVHGSANSHTAILARMMNIPALITVPLMLDELAPGMESGLEAIVDCNQNYFILSPTQVEKEEAILKVTETKQQEEQLLSLKGKDNITKAGRRIDIFANIGAVEDVEYVLQNDAGGVGLFRSEFLYIGRKELPSEEEQFQAYKEVLEKLADKKVVIRTLDIGADKQADYLNLAKEENPALGYRAIRICLTQQEIFKTQLRALFRASAYGHLAIMYPMITAVEEVKEIKKISDQVKAELKAEGIVYKDVEEGIMIETPAAALISDELAKLVDFFSVGTNDLTQYTLAIDRQNSKLDAFYRPHHKAILKLIKMAADHIHKEGKWIGICGELGADESLTQTFLDMGIDELSVSPSKILKLRKQILEMDE